MQITKLTNELFGTTDNRWTIRSTEWQTEGVRSVGRTKRRWRDCVVTGSGMDKDSKGQRKMEDTA